MKLLFIWFDIAQEALLKDCGMTYKSIEDLGFLFVPLSSECEYKHPVFYGDKIVVRVSVTQLSVVKVSFAYEIIREKDVKTIALAKSSHVFVDSSFRPQSLKNTLPALYKKLDALL